MKEMVYDFDKPGILDEGELQGYKYMVVSYGSHPCAYVQVPEGHPFHGKHYDKINICCHGGLTFSGDHYHHAGRFALERDGFWIGWDYAHGGDYIASPGVNLDGHRYTTQEILSDIALVVGQLVGEALKQQERSNDP